eukprot:scaffold55212_cov62-Attheya_sp.AAC.1
MRVSFVALVAGFMGFYPCVCLSFASPQRYGSSSFVSTITNVRYYHRHQQDQLMATSNNIPEEDKSSVTGGDYSNDANADDVEDSSSLKANRFSKFAPDANLPTEEFRAQLRENMKADLERRRKEDPNRGNQPAKNYLDNFYEHFCIIY